LSGLNTEIIRSDSSHEGELSFNKINKIQVAANSSNMNTHINSSSSEDNTHPMEEVAANGLFSEVDTPQLYIPEIPSPSDPFNLSSAAGFGSMASFE
jgi:hypothetical protein